MELFPWKASVDSITAFHSSMVTALFCLDKIVGRLESKLQALRHASRTAGLVNQKLSLKSAITDSTIAAVISMAQYEHHQNRFQQGSAHVQGLWQISQLRCGVSNLTGSPSGLGLKCCGTPPQPNATIVFILIFRENRS